MQMIEIQDWQSPEVRTITLTQDIGDATYDLRVRQFIPKEGDALERAWNSRTPQRPFPCAPYAIASMKETAQLLCNFVDRNIGVFVEYYTDETDKLIRNTYVMAYRYAHIIERKVESDLLTSVLRLWVASRMESKQERICSFETLGMTPQDWDSEASNYGNICVPPVMQAQIEIITTCHVLLPMKKAVLKGLNALVIANEPQSWFTIYLVMFVLLHSCALLTQAENARAKRESPLSSHVSHINILLLALQLTESRCGTITRLLSKNSTTVPR